MIGTEKPDRLSLARCNDESVCFALPLVCMKWTDLAELASAPEAKRPTEALIGALRKGAGR